MSEESNVQEKGDDVDVENMKVTELKKKLKSFGLPATGNKSELIERLQEAMISGKDISSTEAEVDLETSLLNDSGEAISIPNTSDNTFLDEFSLSSPEKDTSKESANKAVDSTTNSNPTAVPLKKRAVTKAPNEAVKVEKKIVLKRNNIPTPKFIPSKPAVPIKRISVITEAKSEGKEIDIKKDGRGDEKEVCKALPGTVIRLSGTNTKGLSELERIQLRAKRFNIQPASRPGKLSEAAKQNLISSITSNTISTSSTNVSDIEAKHKRAFRFGFNVPKTLRQMEQQAMMSKRKSKFGEGNEITNTEEQEAKKKKRAERFGL